jgi:hypothetical protein
MAKTTIGTSTRKVPLNLATLADLSGGQAGVAINAAIAAAIRDTEDRGSDKKARKVVIEIEFKKLGDENVTTAVRAKTAIPPYQTEQTVGNLRLKQGGGVELEFNPLNGENPDQRTFDTDEG